MIPAPTWRYGVKVVQPTAMKEEIVSNSPSSYLFTSESVTEGHPDKICDQISDAILDAILTKEIELASQNYIAPNGYPADPTQVRCACETMATTGMVMEIGRAHV